MQRRGIAAATLVIMTGTLTTSVLGYLRALTVARYFGQSNQTDAFYAALVVPQMFYDQIIGGAVAAALIPTFSRLAAEDDGELWLVVRTILAVAAAVVLSATILLEALANPLMHAIASGFLLHGKAGTLPLSVKLVRILLPSLIFLACSAVVLATLYSLGRRAPSSFAPSLYHLGIVIAAAVGSVRWGITALAVGAVAGAAGQLAAQLPWLLRARRRFGADGAPTATARWIDIHHPAVRRILRLYAPVAAGLAISIAGQIVDINFKSHLPQHGGLTAMQNATQLVQFPVGIVAAALSLAVLPTLSLDAAAQRLEAFKDTLAQGIRMSLVLMVPAMIALLTLSTPIVALLLQRGHFNHIDTVHTATAMAGYAPQLPLVGVDQLLIFAFYARHNTLTPALAGVLGVGVYVLTAALLLVPLTILGLALANTIQITVHALLLLWLLVRVIGPLSGRRLEATVAKLAVAAGASAAVALAVERWLSPTGSGFASRLVALALPGCALLLVYGALLALLRVGEARVLAGVVTRRLTS